MWSNLVAAFFIIGLFVMAFITPAAFAKGIYTIEYETVGIQDRLLCKIPILNICKAEKLYTGKFSVVGISYIILTVSFLLRLVVYNIARTNAVLTLVTVTLVCLAIIFSYIANVYVVFIVIHDAHVKSLASVILYAVIFPIGQYYIGNFLAATIKSFEREEATFK